MSRTQGLKYILATTAGKGPYTGNVLKGEIAFRLRKAFREGEGGILQGPRCVKAIASFIRGILGGT